MTNKSKGMKKVVLTTLESVGSCELSVEYALQWGASFGP